MVATVDIVVPVYNEEQALPRSILILTDFLKDNLPNPWRVVIADNASTDDTRSVSEMLCERYAGVGYLHLPQKGRGRALRTAWMDSTADIVSYMDVDLSTDLVHFPQLVQALESGDHIAIGSRLSKDSRVTRSLKREVISRGYNLMIRSMFFPGNYAAGSTGHRPSLQERQLVLRHRAIANCRQARIPYQVGAGEMGRRPH